MVWKSCASCNRVYAVVRGIPTAHSAAPLNEVIQSTEPYVWPSGKGTVRGQSIVPLYPTVVDAVQNDPKLYELLALEYVLILLPLVLVFWSASLILSHSFTQTHRYYVFKDETFRALDCCISEKIGYNE
ncbi:MAG TPA: hypothetical protein VGK10_20175 [Prolixibacteraceae bacterium]